MGRFDAFDPDLPAIWSPAPRLPGLARLAALCDLNRPAAEANGRQIQPSACARLSLATRAREAAATIHCQELLTPC